MTRGEKIFIKCEPFLERLSPAAEHVQCTNSRRRNVSFALHLIPRNVVLSLFIRLHFGEEMGVRVNNPVSFEIAHG